MQGRGSLEILYRLWHQVTFHTFTVHRIQGGEMQCRLYPQHFLITRGIEKVEYREIRRWGPFLQDNLVWWYVDRHCRRVCAIDDLDDPTMYYILDARYPLQSRVLGTWFGSLCIWSSMKAHFVFLVPAIMWVFRLFAHRKYAQSMV